MWANPGMMTAPLPFQHIPIPTPFGIPYPGYPLGLAGVVPDYNTALYSTVNPFFGAASRTSPSHMPEVSRLQGLSHLGFQFNPRSPLIQRLQPSRHPTSSRSFSSLIQENKCNLSPISTLSSPSTDVPIWQLSPVADVDGTIPSVKGSPWPSYQHSTPISGARGHPTTPSASHQTSNWHSTNMNSSRPATSSASDHIRQHSSSSSKGTKGQHSTAYTSTSKRKTNYSTSELPTKQRKDNPSEDVSPPAVGYIEKSTSSKVAQGKVAAQDSVASFQTEPLDLSCRSRSTKRSRDDISESAECLDNVYENKRIKIELLSPEDNTYKCGIDDCKSTFTTNSEKARHEKRHTTVYSCLFSNCDRRYSEIQNLQIHLTGHGSHNINPIIHTGPTRLACVPISLTDTIHNNPARTMFMPESYPNGNILTLRSGENKPNSDLNSGSARNGRASGSLGKEEKILAEEMFRQDNMSGSDRSASMEGSGSADSASESVDSGNGSAENVVADKDPKKSKARRSLHLWSKRSDDSIHEEWKMPEEKERVFFCVQCDFQTFDKDQAKSHKRSLQHKVKQRCTLCGKEFSYQGDTWSHIQQMHRPYHLRPFKCPYEGCDGAYSMQKLLNFHCKYVHSEKPYECSHPGCGKRYATQSMLKHHQFVHTDLYQCSWPNCGKTFRDDYNLRTHHMIHTGKKPRQCQLCDYSCVQKNSMNWHMKSKHKETLAA